jgi:CDP-paratose 2-epimerase
MHFIAAMYNRIVPNRIFSYKGNQVRDQIHCADLVAAFDHYYRGPHPGNAYNIGGARWSTDS